MKKEILALLAELKGQRDEAVRRHTEFDALVSKEMQKIATAISGQPECRPGAGGVADMTVAVVERLKKELEELRKAVEPKTGGILRDIARPRNGETPMESKANVRAG